MRKLEDIQESINLIHEFINDFDIIAVVNPDLIIEFSHTFDYTGKKEYENFHQLRFKCAVCAEHYESDLPVIALFCSEDCFVQYFKINSYFRTRVVELKHPIEVTIEKFELLARQYSDIFEDEEDLEELDEKEDKILAGIHYFMDEWRWELKSFYDLITSLSELPIAIKREDIDDSSSIHRD